MIFLQLMQARKGFLKAGSWCSSTSTWRNTD